MIRDARIHFLVNQGGMEMAGIESDQPKLRHGSVLQQRVYCRLRDGFVYFGRGARGRDGPDGFTVNLNGETALVGEAVWKREHPEVAALELIGRGLGRT